MRVGIPLSAERCRVCVWIVQLTCQGVRRGPRCYRAYIKPLIGTEGKPNTDGICTVWWRGFSGFTAICRAAQAGEWRWPEIGKEKLGRWSAERGPERESDIQWGDWTQGCTERKKQREMLAQTTPTQDQEELNPQTSRITPLGLIALCSSYMIILCSLFTHGKSGVLGIYASFSANGFNSSVWAKKPHPHQTMCSHVHYAGYKRPVKDKKLTHSTFKCSLML